MHDFCFTIPYGLAVLAGGLLGYLRRGSTASLAGGAGSGLLLLLAGYLSLHAFHKRRNSFLALALETRMYFFSFTSFFQKIVLLFRRMRHTVCMLLTLILKFANCTVFNESGSAACSIELKISGNL
jgi:uncharacterized membrane protein (UPF0136 family)